MSSLTIDNKNMNKNNDSRISFESSQPKAGAMNLVSSRSSYPTTKQEIAPKPRPKRSQPRLEKRVSIDIMPMTLEEIEWAMTDAKIQDEDREIQEARERIRRKKEARALKLALANAQ